MRCQSFTFPTTNTYQLIIWADSGLGRGLQVTKQYSFCACLPYCSNAWLLQPGCPYNPPLHAPIRGQAHL